MSLKVDTCASHVGKMHALVNSRRYAACAYNNARKCCFLHL